MIAAATAEHEARHAAAALLLDLPIVKASAVPVEGHSAGRVRVEFDPERLRESMIMVLAGGLGEPGWPPGGR